MEFCRAGDVFLRATPPSVALFLLPTAQCPKTCTRIIRSSRTWRRPAQPAAPHLRRSFAATALHPQQAAAAVKEDDTDTTIQQQQESSPQQHTSSGTPALDFSNSTRPINRTPEIDPLTDDRLSIFDKNKDKRPSRPLSTMQRNLEQQHNPAKLSSLSELLTTLETARGENFKSKGIDTDLMLDPSLARLSPEERQRRVNIQRGQLMKEIIHKTAFVPDLAKPGFELGPSLGRSVVVAPDRNVDLGRAFRLLDVQCSVNKVRQDVRTQRFHERPGVKRKRLKQERWRRRFKAGFQAVVKRVEDLRRKGW